MKRAVCLLALIAFCALIGKGWYVAKDGFSLSRTRCVRLEPGDHLTKGALSIDPTLVKALQQTYTYLGRGHQCYAFDSEDGKYVIKLPRYDRYELSFFLRSCPFSWIIDRRNAVYVDIKRRLQFITESFRLAFEELKKETGLLYLHLDRTKDLAIPLKIKDRLGRLHVLDANRTFFILQEKKPIMMASFQKSLQERDRVIAEQILDDFLHVISSRSQKGIYNKDPSFLRNFGWEKGRGVQIDVGSFYRKSGISLKEAREASFQETINHVRKWLSEVDAEMLCTFDEKVQAVKNSWDSSTKDYQ